MRVSPSQLQRAFDGFGTAIREKYAIESGPLRQLARERSLIRVVEQIRDVRSAACFAPNHTNNAWMSVTQRVDGDARQKVEIGTAIGIVQTATPAVGENHGRAAVRVHQVARLFGYECCRR